MGIMGRMNLPWDEKEYIRGIPNEPEEDSPLVLLLVISLSLLSVHVSLDWRLEIMLVLAFEPGPIVGYVW